MKSCSRTLRRKLSTMSVKKAGEIYKSMSACRLRWKLTEFKNAYKYLLTVAYQNDLHIHSLTLNNKSLAQTLQKEKENSALQLKERLNTQSTYFELLKEYSLLKTKLSSIEQNLMQVSDRIKSAMIPNLVMLSDDVTAVKLDCDLLSGIVGTTYNINNANAQPRECPKLDHSVSRKFQIISQANVPSPLLEEAEEEVVQITTRKCKGRLRNILNSSGLRGDRRIHRSLILSATTSESSFTDNSAITERHSENRDSEPECSQSPRVWPRSPAFSPVLPASPAVLLRRTLTPNNSIEPKELTHSSVEEVTIDKKSNSSNQSDEDISHNVTRVARKRSTYTSYFDNDDNITHSTLLTERKRSKRSHYFKTNDEKQDVKAAPKRSTRRSGTAHNSHSEENIDPSSRKSERKRSSSTRGSIPVENQPPTDCTLLGDRKKKNHRISHEEVDLTRSTNKTEYKKSCLTTFGNETGSEISFTEGRRLRTRNNVSYKEVPLNVKMRKS